MTNFFKVFLIAEFGENFTFSGLKSFFMLMIRTTGRT